MKNSTQQEIVLVTGGRLYWYKLYTAASESGLCGKNNSPLDEQKR